MLTKQASAYQGHGSTIVSLRLFKKCSKRALRSDVNVMILKHQAAPCCSLYTKQKFNDVLPQSLRLVIIAQNAGRKPIVPRLHNRHAGSWLLRTGLATVFSRCFFPGLTGAGNFRSVSSTVRKSLAN
mmetsp:Transcript_111376/g.208942  ORF Transcript_111376/g.208942 Transcript_111376/m.208942 type:complete len:127 (+) Transcript_111376:123-503(+)